MYNILCPLCAGHLYEGEVCRSCYAPAELIESIAARGKPPRFVGVLGPSGVGKTVYLGMLLDLLSRGVGGLHGMARSPFSLSLHRSLILALEKQRFPDKTPNEPDRWQWVHCEVSGTKRGQEFDVVTPDVAGEAVMAELDNPRSNKTVRALIGRCSALVVLADIVQVVADGQGQELFAMQLISYLDTLRQTAKKRKVEIPVALVFTKVDLFEEPIKDPEDFARANAPALWKLCETRLQHYKFFCSGVAGSVGKLVDRSGQETLVPLRVEPRGIIEPFAWMMTQLR
ncbi:TRAFAC clade GTPase domain-containing protein [Singulisphaera acidiphila]|uniref:Double-GTPase 2 domain-containing protein n=1 Tax=Singulisphaera acidiphila (strain ATCC BAA-1392 / DSM 18658 / VKM B-2454 / MOB10) TaxID=886293 RepID=L0DFQ3_SINAD|nr:GTPase domain-containing protein [Singulisphaera acidiphila]AGA27685.1 hypothetical protein Sinac_3424 [Singulisphaera acidiphila DSM 18658]